MTAPPPESPDSQSRWYDEVVLPMLLASGRTSYGNAIAAALRAAGFDDMPPRGSRVVGGIRRNGADLDDVPHLLGVNRETASRLIDTLVTRGYVERVRPQDDPLRATVGLTDRGRAAAQEINEAVDGVDAELRQRVGAEDLATARRVLGTLTEIGRGGPVGDGSAPS